MTIRPMLELADLEREGVIEVTAGSGVLGTFEFTDDEDYFLFMPQPGRRYGIAADSDLNAELGIFVLPTLAAAGSDNDSGPGLNPALTLDAPDVPVAVLIEVDTAFTREPGEEEGDPGALGAYRLTVTDLGPTEQPVPPGDSVGQSLETAGGVTVGQPFAEAIDEPGDVDLYRVYLEANRAYQLSALGQDGFDPYIEVLGADGTPIGENDNGEDTLDASVAIRVLQNGFYIVGVTASDLETGQGGYVLDVQDLGAFLPPDGGDAVGDAPASATRVEIGQTTAGRIDTAADLDVYAALLEEGATYRFEVTSFGGVDPQLFLFDGDGTELAAVDDVGGDSDPVLTVTPEESAIYFVAVDGVGETTGDFDLSSALVSPAGLLSNGARDVALLYEAALDRSAAEEEGAGGLNFWIDAREDGLSLRALARAFLEAPEFVTAVGDPDVIDDRTLVTGLYENVLDREADEEGLGFWLGVLEENDAETLLIAFARSEENVGNSTDIERLAQVAPGEWDFV